MAAKYWPVVVLREENASLFPVRKINRSTVAEYLQSGHRFTMRGITLYTKPTEVLEVGFSIRRSAGIAVLRNKTRRLFKGVMNNFKPAFTNGTGYLFMFHRSFISSDTLKRSVQQLVDRANAAA